VVLIHGATVPYYIWDPTFHALAAAGFRVLRYDLYGRGWSDRPKATYDRDLYETQLLELLDVLRVPQPVDLVGLSMGGAIATGFTARHPARVRKLALVSPVSQQGSIGPLAIPLVGEYLMATSVAPSLPGRQMTDFAHPDRFPDWADRYREQMRYHGFRRAILSSYRHFSTDDPWPYYEQVGEQRRPVLLIWGRLDTTLPFARSDAVREALNAEFAPVDDGGPRAHCERPEVGAPVVIEFLRRGAPKGAGVLAAVAGANR
jgi:pimeloyl-ACP methyl ester carboxylesterase